MEHFKTHPLYKRHNIDSAMSSLWEFYKSRFLTFFIISFAMSLVIQYASTTVNIEELSKTTDPFEMLEKMKSLMGPILLISLLNLFFTTIFQYYVIYSPLDSENNFIRSAGKSLRYFLPYLIIMILLAVAGSVAIVLGILVLIVGVFFSILYIVTLYMFILPIMMIENINIAETISRTFKLAHRNFWSNMAWVAVLIIILVVVSIILSGIILLPFTGSFIKTIVNPDEASELIKVTTNPLFIILSAAVSAVTFPFMPIFACILYFNSRASEEQVHSFSPENSDNDKVRVEDLYAKPYSDEHPENPETKE